MKLSGHWSTELLVRTCEIYAFLCGWFIIFHNYIYLIRKLVLTALLIEGHDVTKLASMAKLKAGRLAREVADGCLQFWGGMGYTQVSHMIALLE